MDYLRIYEEFISDRRLKEDCLLSSGGYFEKHHITPKSINGTNQKHNLIALTAEDHFFAHLLLAKILGGNQWSSVAIMMERKGRLGGSWGVSRARYAFAKELISKHLKLSGVNAGENNGMYSDEILTFRHTDGHYITGTRSELVRDTKLTHPDVCFLVKGRDGRKRVLGYYNPSHFSLEDIPQKPSIHTEAVSFTNLNGEIRVCTPKELSVYVFGKSRSKDSDLYKMLKGDLNLFHGWYLTKRGYKGWSGKDRNYFEDPHLYTLKHDDGRVLRLTNKQATLTLAPGIIKQIKHNVSKKSRGWRIIAVD